MVDGWITKRVLITVKTYPTPAWKGGEVVCTAGITAEGEWVRLFPIPYRLLDNDRRFRKYQWVEVRTIRARADHRPESYQVDLDSIRVLSEPLKTLNYWQARKEVVFPLSSRSMCQVQNERDANGFPTLGIFRPKEIKALHIKPTEEDWSEANLARLGQLRLIESLPIQQLQKIPFDFKYQYTCDEVGCRGHTMTCLDWEISQAYRIYSRKYRHDWESKLRGRFERGMIEKNDTYFYVGTVHGHPRTWVIVGLFYPMKPKG